MRYLTLGEVVALPVPRREDERREDVEQLTEPTPPELVAFDPLQPGGWVRSGGGGQIVGRTLIVPRQVYDATQNAKKNPEVLEGLRRTFEPLEGATRRAALGSLGRSVVWNRAVPRRLPPGSDPGRSPEPPTRQGLERTDL